MNTETKREITLKIGNVPYILTIERAGQEYLSTGDRVQVKGTLKSCAQPDVDYQIDDRLDFGTRLTAAIAAARDITERTYCEQNSWLPWFICSAYGTSWSQLFSLVESNLRACARVLQSLWDARQQVLADAEK